MKNNFRKAALSTICMLLVAVMSLTGATYAWFTAGETATISGMQMDVTAADGGVQISAQVNGTEWTNWASKVTLQNSTATNLKPASTTDAISFYGITVSETDSTSATIAAVTNETSTYYVSNRIRLKNPAVDSVVISLSSLSSIDQSDATGVTATDIEKAARVAFILTDENGTPLTDNDAKTYFWSMNSGDTYYGLNEAGTVTLTNGFATTNGASVTMTDPGECEITLPGITRSQDDNSIVETVVYVTIVVWVEGQDADCINLNAGGSFDVDIQFAVDEDATNALNN